MWNRLKNSLTAFALSSALVLGLGAIAEPAAKVPPSMSPSFASAEQQLAYQLAVSLTVLAIDAAISERNTATGLIPAAPKATERSASLHSWRMPFYSFASRVTRARES